MLILINTKQIWQLLNFQDCNLHYRNLEVCRVPTAHGEAQKTLGKGFAVCYARQIALGVYRVGKRFFAECFLSGTRQTLCRVLNLTLGKKKAT